MYLTIREYAEVRSLREIGRRVGEGLLPTLRDMAGFRAYYAVGTDDGCGAFSISIFDHRDEALAANEQTRAWVVATLRDLAPEPPSVMGGEIIHDAVALADQPGRDGYVSVYVFDGAASLERVWPGVRAVVAPRLAQRPGFRRLYTMASEAHSNRGIAVTVFESRETASVAQEYVLAAIATELMDLLLNPPTVTRGEILVAGTA